MTSELLHRRQFLARSASLAGAVALPVAWPITSSWAAPAPAGTDERILVVVELSGGNDGLNTVVPYGDDTYYRHRPTIGIRPEEVIKLDEHFGLNSGMLGFERLWKNGELAIIHGCGYEQPSFSHFTSMAYWHTAAPNSGDEFGWVGRVADVMAPRPTANLIVNIDRAQSLAVKSQVHNPVVFDEPERFRRNALNAEKPLFSYVSDESGMNQSRAYLNSVAASARDASHLIREAWRNYQSHVDYGILPVDLDKVAACIEARLPTRLYYVAFRNNAFDTHVQQPALHSRLLTYASDAVHAFIRDMERIGMGDRVAVLVFSEFGRRVPENANLGTDHGTANVMFLAGKGVKGGHYGEPPNLGELDDGDNLVHTVDFRRVYATAIDGWLGLDAAPRILKGQFAPFPVFA